MPESKRLAAINTGTDTPKAWKIYRLLEENCASAGLGLVSLEEILSIYKLWDNIVVTKTLLHWN